MATLDEVAAKLAAIEAKIHAQEQDGELNQFIGMYGNEFSNDRDIGQSILGHLNAQGIGLQEAADAVKEIMDKLRAEHAELGRKINKVEMAMADAQQEAAAVTSPPPPIEPPQGDSMAPPLEGPPADGPVSDTNFPPGPPSDLPPMPDMPLPEGDMLSDQRFKNWRPTVVSDERLKTVAKEQLGTLSDDDIAIIDALCGLPGVSDDDIINVLLADEDDPEEGSMAMFDAVLDRAGDVSDEEALEADEKVEGAAGALGGRSHSVSLGQKDPDLALENLLSDENMKNIGGEPEKELDEGSLIMRTLLGK